MQSKPSPLPSLLHDVTALWTRHSDQGLSSLKMVERSHSRALKATVLPHYSGLPLHLTPLTVAHETARSKGKRLDLIPVVFTECTTTPGT